MFTGGLILREHECLCAMSQKRHLTRIILFTVNYCLFANGDISINMIKSNGKDNNVVLESFLKIRQSGFSLIHFFLIKMKYKARISQ